MKARQVGNPLGGISQGRDGILDFLCRHIGLKSGQADGGDDFAFLAADRNGVAVIFQNILFPVPGQILGADPLQFPL
jgi:hypothetical protein